MNEAALWDRRDEVEHPTPIGYYLEDQYTFATPLDELLEREVILQKREARMYDGETVRCELKWNPRVSCTTCPVHEIGQDTPLSILCRLGREQERVQGLIAVKQATLDGEL